MRFKKRKTLNKKDFESIWFKISLFAYNYEPGQ